MKNFLIILSFLMIARADFATSSTDWREGDGYGDGRGGDGYGDGRGGRRRVRSGYGGDGDSRADREELNRLKRIQELEEKERAARKRGSKVPSCRFFDTTGAVPKDRSGNTPLDKKGFPQGTYEIIKLSGTGNGRHPRTKAAFSFKVHRKFVDCHGAVPKNRAGNIALAENGLPEGTNSFNERSGEGSGSHKRTGAAFSFKVIVK